MKKSCLVVALMLILLATTVSIIGYKVFFVPKGIEVNYTQFQSRGIDLSKHSGKVDFHGLKADGFSFVFLKASEGEGYVDPKFELYYKGAVEADFQVGAYHFFRMNKGGELQAKHFLRTVRNKHLNLPLVLDVEEWGNSGSGKTTEEIKSELSAFAAHIKRNTGRKVMFYTNESGYRKYVKGKFDDHPLWICSFSNPPNIDRNWDFWQHSHKGRSPHVEGWVDLNVRNKGE